jgi:hypothetical protein
VFERVLEAIRAGGSLGAIHELLKDEWVFVMFGGIVLSRNEIREWMIFIFTFFTMGLTKKLVYSICNCLLN